MMWLFTTVGFFSIVQKTSDPLLTVRARVADDLSQLRDRYMPGLSPTIIGGGADYPFRATISRDDFARGLAQVVQDIDYASFRDEIERVTGRARGPIYTQVWKVLMKLENDPASQSAGPVEKGTLWKRLAYGGIVINHQSRVLLREPQDHFGGYVWTFPKGSCHAGETPGEAVVREVEEETGIIGRIERQLPGTFEAETTLNTYYLMSFERETDWQDLETLRIRWASLDEAEKLIGMTSDAGARAHDLEVLKLAYELHRGAQQNLI
jgi:8-oxo-dGTP pyrophosphatase MutT (NUDIX family)